jgi:hypothetical protein
MKKSARERKFKNAYGADPILPKKKLGQEFTSDDRPKIDEAMKNNYQNLINYSKMKRITENISQMQGNKFINDNNINIKNKNTKNDFTNNNPKGMTFELKTKSKKKFLSNYEIEKAFANKGIHIYDVKEDMGTILNSKDYNKIELKVRDNNNKNNGLELKINRIKEELKNIGYLLKEKYNNNTKREINDLMPQASNKNKIINSMNRNRSAINFDKINEKKYVSKPPIRKRNKEEKITRIYVNLKHKTNANKV